MTKVRVVYDECAKSSKQDRSLNDCLEVGDNYIPLIFDMLLKFRRNTVDLTADIEKAFLMSASKSKTATCCDSFGLMSRLLQDQQLLNIDLTGLFLVCEHHPQFLGQPFPFPPFEKVQPELAKLLEESLYVDDLITGEDNVSRAFSVYEKSKQIVSEGGFSLRKWNSNSKELLTAIKNLEREIEDNRDKMTNHMPKLLLLEADVAQTVGARPSELEGRQFDPRHSIESFSTFFCSV